MVQGSVRSCPQACDLTAPIYGQVTFYYDLTEHYNGKVVSTGKAPSTQEARQFINERLAEDIK